MFTLSFLHFISITVEALLSTSDEIGETTNLLCLFLSVVFIFTHKKSVNTILL